MNKFFQKIGLMLIFTFTFSGCTGEGGSETGVQDLNAWSVQTEHNFTVNIPPGYERISKEKANMSFSDDFEIAYSEIRLDNQFATTFSVYKEDLEESIESKTYALSIFEKAKSFPNFQEISKQETNISDQNTALNEFTFASEDTMESLHAIQTGLVKNKKGYIVWCITREENGNADVCKQIIESLVLK